MFVVLLTLLIQVNGLFDCTYDCTRGSCNPNGSVQNIGLKCDQCQSCPSGGQCYTYNCWICYPNFPYYGKISECNKSGCIPPFGCKLISFTSAQPSCQSADDFCSSPTKTCCQNDNDCNKFFNTCTPPIPLVMNTTTTVTPPTTTPATTTPALSTSFEIPLIVGGVVIGVIVLGIIIGCIVHYIRRRNYVQLSDSDYD